METKLLNFIIKEIYNGTTADEVVEVVFNGQTPIGLKIAGELVNGIKLAKLRAEAETIMGSELWVLLMKRMQYVAQLQSCERAVTEKDLLFSKAMVFWNQEMQKILTNIATIKTEELKKVGIKK